MDRPSNEGFGVGVDIGNEAVDGELQVDDGPEYAALEALARELSQDAEVGVKWKVQRGCRASRCRTLGCLWVA